MIFVDSNILIDVLTPDQAWYAWSRERIAATASTDRLVINTIVVAELSSNFADLASLHRALALWEVGIEALDDEVAFGAGQAFRAYRRRYRERDAMLSDFLIGAHAIRLGAALLTRDAAIYRAYFPDLPLITPETIPMADATAPFRIEGDTGEWEVVIGLEVHAQVTSNAKLFSGAATAFGAEPNTQVSLVDAAMPGMLPVPNRECVRQAVRTGMAIDAQINRWSRFDRKNYFYADLPQGYQISQLYHPLVGEGHLDVAPDEQDPDTLKRIGVERIHVEQDAGKLMHDQHPSRSYVDLNRSGVALMEIVSRPDMRSPAEAGAYLRKLRSILRYVGSCDGNMEEGSMRADVNVSVRKPGDDLGTRTETKNVNSVRFVMQAIEHEAKRQVELIEGGGAVVQETRLFNADTGTTRSMRSKEDAQDYRYFPDPDLLPLELDEAFLDECRASLPELPDAKRQRYESAGVTPYNAGVLTAEVETARWFDALLEAGAPAKAASNWVTGELFGALNRMGKGIADSPVAPAQAAALLALVADGTLSGSLAKQVFEVMLETGQNPAAIVDERGLKQTSDTGAIEAVIAEVLAKNPGQLDQYRAGKTALFGFFVGQTMKAMAGKANPQVINDLLGKALG